MGAMMQQMGSGGARGRGGGGMMGGGFGGQSETPSTHWTTTEKRVMIRAFDFTVKADNSYRYRAHRCSQPESESGRREPRGGHEVEDDARAVV